MTESPLHNDQFPTNPTPTDLALAVLASLALSRTIPADQLSAAGTIFTPILMSLMHRKRRRR